MDEETTIEDMKDMDMSAFFIILMLMFMDEKDRDELIEKFNNEGSDAVTDELNQIELEAMELD